MLAEDVQKQTNTSLEVRIYDLEHEIQALRDEVHNRDKTIKQLTNTIEQTKKRLEDREQQLRKEEEDEVVIDLRKQVQDLQAINSILEAKLTNDAQNAQLLPSLVENIISDKNADLERLRDKLSDTERQLEVFLSLNLDRDQLLSLSRMTSSDRALGDILTLIDHGKPDQQRRDAGKVESLLTSPENVYKRNPNETVPLGLSQLDATPDISSIARIEPGNVHYTLETPLGKPNSTEIHKTAEKHVHFEDVEKLSAENLELKNAVNMKNEIIKEYSERLKALEELESNVEEMRKNLQLTEEALKKASESFESELKEMKDAEKILRVELAEKKVHLTEKQQQLEVYEQDSLRKDQMYINLAKEKREIEKNLKELQSESEKYKNFDIIIAEKNKEIYSLEEQLAELTEPNVRIDALEKELADAKVELVTLKEKLKALDEELSQKNIALEDNHQKLEENKKVISDKDEINQKLLKELENGSLKIQELNKEIAGVKAMEIGFGEAREELIKNVAKLQDLLVDRECEIEILNEDAKHYQEKIAKLESDLKETRSDSTSEVELKMVKSRKEIAEKDLEISKFKTNVDALNTEIGHLQEVLGEKDRIIEQMTEDTKSLHVNLETIQSKMQETGNIVDLVNRLREEQKANLDLQEEVHTLKAMLLSYENNKEANAMTASIEEITKQVGRELDLSAHLDSSILNALETGEQLNLEDEIDVDTLKAAVMKERTANLELKKAEDGLRKTIGDLEEKLENAAVRIVKLQTALEKEKRNSNEIQIEDAKLIEQMRIR